MIKFSFEKRVGKQVREAILDFSFLLLDVVHIKHPILTIVHGGPGLPFEKNNRLGCFLVNENNEVKIYLDGNMSRIGRIIKCDDKGMILAEILITFAHELGHYEKWRDGKSITERGAEKRAISIYNQIYDKYLERENAIIK